MLAHVIELRTGIATATADLASGGRVASIRVGDVELLVPGTPRDDPTMWGAFPATPWVGRLRDARFEHAGETHTLAASLPPHAGHGTVFARPWTRTDDGADPTAATLRCDLGPGWPLGGHAEQVMRLGPHELRCSLAVVAGDRSMPAEVGWHPWFRSAGPVAFEATAMYERSGLLPTGRLVEPSAPPWDDCFVVDGPVRFPIGPLTVGVTSDAECVVVFDQLAHRPSPHRLAVEPQSGPPDAFHLAPRVLQPGERLQRTMIIAWERTDTAAEPTTVPSSR